MPEDGWERLREVLLCGVQGRETKMHHPLHARLQHLPKLQLRDMQAGAQWPSMLVSVPPPHLSPAALLSTPCGVRVNSEGGGLRVFAGPDSRWLPFPTCSFSPLQLPDHRH